jgi:hypothetical protein
MALSFDQRPLSPTVKGQALVYECSSSNVAQTGFRFKYTVTYAWQLETAVQSYYVQPDPLGAGMLNIRSTADQYSQVDVTSNGVTTSIHLTSLSVWFAANYNNYIAVTVAVQDAWEVAGVLTDSPAGSNTPISSTINIWAGSFQAKDGAYPSTNILLPDGNSVYVLTNRTWNNWKMAATYGLEDAIAIPVNEDTYGCWAMINKATVWNEIRYEIFDSSGTQLGSTYDIASISDGVDAQRLLYAPLYPKNVSENLLSDLGFIEPPNHTSDWAYYTMQFMLTNVAKSKVYVMYKDCENRFDPVQIAWANSLGGWDYETFDKKSTPSYQVERKRYTKVLGTYVGDYTQFSYDRGVTDFNNTVERYLTVTKGNVTAEMYSFYVDLMRSKNIQLVGNDGVVESLVLMDTNFDEYRLKRAEQKEVSFRFRYANNLW